VPDSRKLDVGIIVRASPWRRRTGGSGGLEILIETDPSQEFAECGRISKGGMVSIRRRC
jgi:hypothetical protein